MKTNFSLTFYRMTENVDTTDTESTTEVMGLTGPFWELSSRDTSWYTKWCHLTVRVSEDKKGMHAPFQGSDPQPYRLWRSPSLSSW
jgi:hypothetical protein